MRRLALLAVVAAVVTGAPAVAATNHMPKPQIQDGAGDWAVPSQDILDGTITANAKTITATIRLSAAPVPGLATQYYVAFSVGCKGYVATYHWTGVPQTEQASFDEYACPTASSTPALPDKPIATHPATVTVAGNTIQITFGTLRALRPGVRVYAAAIAYTYAMVSTNTEPWKGGTGGDMAISKQFTLGK
ncbi:MAG: hypothetical protein QOC82_1937 [Frankiaceae bacterium]|jgi:hypothetical protein|nr:hypothetical protein [Frankiaceae bacterium]